MYVIKKNAFLIGITIVILAACTPSRSTEATATVTATGTPLPPPQAVDLGTLGKGAVSDAAWSPEGNLLAVRSSTGVHFHNTQTWEVVKTIPDCARKHHRLHKWGKFGPDGHFFGGTK